MWALKSKLVHTVTCCIYWMQDIWVCLMCAVWVGVCVAPVWICRWASRASSFWNWAPHWSQTMAFSPATRQKNAKVIQSSSFWRSSGGAWCHISYLNPSNTSNDLVPVSWKSAGFTSVKLAGKNTVYNVLEDM